MSRGCIKNPPLCFDLILTLMLDSKIKDFVKPFYQLASFILSTGLPWVHSTI